MLSGADYDRHGDLKKSCENAFTMGRGEFPENTTQLLSKLINWRPAGGTQRLQHNNPRPQHNVPDEDGLNFAQEGDEPETGAQMFPGGGATTGVEVQECVLNQQRRHWMKRQPNSQRLHACTVGLGSTI